MILSSYEPLVISSQPQRSVKQRPRLPPPSKIPSTAVEMPGDTSNSSISFLDVQFGALEFGCDVNVNDRSNQDRYNAGGIKSGTSVAESSSTSMKNGANATSAVSGEVARTPAVQKFSSITKIVSQCINVL